MTVTVRQVGLVEHVIAQVNHIVLSAVHVAHADVINVEADEALGRCGARHMHGKVNGITIRAEALVVRIVTDGRYPVRRRVAGALRQASDDLGTAVIKAGVQNLRRD
eukprot:2075579-Pleurochrysis_carterae.AAC.3